MGRASHAAATVSQVHTAIPVPRMPEQRTPRNSCRTELTQVPGVLRVVPQLNIHPPYCRRRTSMPFANISQSISNTLLSNNFYRYDVSVHIVPIVYT